MEERTPYGRKLAHPEWQKKRLEILQRDGFQCRGCGSTEKELHVHHIYYIPGTLPQDHPGNALITLCYECHAEEEEQLSYLKAMMVQRLRSLGNNAFAIQNLLIAVQQASIKGPIDAFDCAKLILNYIELNDAQREQVDELMKYLKEKNA